MADPDDSADKPKLGLYGARPSASADASRRKQIERDLAMSPRERILTALRLGHRLQRLAPDVAARRRRHPPEI